MIRSFVVITVKVKVKWLQTYVKMMIYRPNPGGFINP